MKPLIKMKDGLWHTMTKRGLIPHASWDEAAKTARAESAKAWELEKAAESKQEEAENAAKAEAENAHAEAEKAQHEEDEKALSHIALVYSELAALNSHRFAVSYIADEYDLEKKEVLSILRKKKVYGGQLT